MSGDSSSSPKLRPDRGAERAYPNLIHDNKLDKGGHFAGWEQPALLAADVRAGFKSLGGSAFP